MSARWKYSVTIPSWTQTKLEGDEDVVFYRVEVKILPPEGKGIPKTRTVLRRYNHFHRLHGKLVEEAGQDCVQGKDVPTKRSIFKISKRPELIERRRKELQQWLWKLVNDPVTAQTRALNVFLELSEAAKMETRTPPAILAIQRAESAMSRPYAISEGESSPRGSEASGFTSASRMTDHSRLAESTFSMQPPLPADLPNSRSFADWRSTKSLQEGRSVADRNSDLGIRQSEANHRLGLRVEQRGTLKRLVKELQDRLSIATEDFQSIVEAMEAEKEAKRQLVLRVAHLENELGSDHGVREAELERLLQQVAEMDTLTDQPAFWHRRKPSEGVNALQEVSRKLEMLRSDLEETRSARESLQKENAELKQEAEAMKGRLASSAQSQAEELDTLTANQQEKLSGIQKAHRKDTEELESRWQAKMEEAETQASALRDEQEEVWMAKLASLQKEMQARDSEGQSRANASLEIERASVEAQDKFIADKKVLAKAVKSLRKQVAEHEARQLKTESQEAELDTLRTELKTAHTSLQDASEKRNAAEAIVATLQGDIEAHHKSRAIQQSEAELKDQETQRQIAQLEARLSTLTANEAAKDTAAAGRAAEAQRALAAAEEQLAAETRDHAALVADLEARLAETSAQLRDSDASLASLIATQDEGNAHLSAAQAEKEKQTKRFQELQEQASQTETALTDAKAQCKQLLLSQQALRLELEEKQIQADQHCHQQEQLQSLREECGRLQDHLAEAKALIAAKDEKPAPLPVQLSLLVKDTSAPAKIAARSTDGLDLDEGDVAETSPQVARGSELSYPPQESKSAEAALQPLDPLEPAHAKQAAGRAFLLDSGAASQIGTELNAAGSSKEFFFGAPSETGAPGPVSLSSPDKQISQASNKETKLQSNSPTSSSQRPAVRDKQSIATSRAVSLWGDSAGTQTQVPPANPDCQRASLDSSTRQSQDEKLSLSSMDAAAVDWDLRELKAGPASETNCTPAGPQEEFTNPTVSVFSGLDDPSTDAELQPPMTSSKGLDQNLLKSFGVGASEAAQLVRSSQSFKSSSTRPSAGSASLEVQSADHAQPDYRQQSGGTEDPFASVAGLDLFAGMEVKPLEWNEPAEVKPFAGARTASGLSSVGEGSQKSGALASLGPASLSIEPHSKHPETQVHSNLPDQNGPRQASLDISDLDPADFDAPASPSEIILPASARTESPLSQVGQVSPSTEPQLLPFSGPQESEGLPWSNLQAKNSIDRLRALPGAEAPALVPAVSAKRPEPGGANSSDAQPTEGRRHSMGSVPTAQETSMARQPGEKGQFKRIGSSSLPHPAWTVGSAAIAAPNSSPSSVGGLMTRWGFSMPGNAAAKQQAASSDETKGISSGYQNVLNKEKIENFARNFIRKSNS